MLGRERRKQSSLWNLQNRLPYFVAQDFTNQTQKRGSLILEQLAETDEEKTEYNRYWPFEWSRALEINSGSHLSKNSVDYKFASTTTMCTFSLAYFMQKVSWNFIMLISHVTWLVAIAPPLRMSDGYNSFKNRPAYFLNEKQVNT